jgi:hypothetical protein
MRGGPGHQQQFDPACNFESAANVRKSALYLVCRQCHLAGNLAVGVPQSKQVDEVTL